MRCSSRYGNKGCKGQGGKGKGKEADSKKKCNKRSLKRVRFKSLESLKKCITYNNNYDFKDY